MMSLNSCFNCNILWDFLFFDCMDFTINSVIQTLITFKYFEETLSPGIILTLLSVLRAAVAATSAGSAFSKSASHSLCFWDTSV